MKAGIMEMADIFVVNKSDLPGAQRMATDIQRIAAVTHRPEGAWRAPILLTSAEQPDSIRALSEAIDGHRIWRNADPRRHQHLRAQRARYRLRRLLEMHTAEAIAVQPDEFFDIPRQRQLAAVMDAMRVTLDA